MQLRKKIGVVIWCTVATVLALIVVAYSLYEILILRVVEVANIMRAVVILASLGITMWRLLARNTKKTASKKVLREQYHHIVGTAFMNDAKKEKQFFRAVTLWNKGKFDKAISILETLALQCTKGNEHFAVLFFTARSYCDMKLYRKAVELYEKSLVYAENSSAASNLGYSYQCMGDFEQAISSYEWATRLDPKNAYAYNNIAQLYLENGAYEKAIEYAEKSVSCNAKLYQAWKAQAISYAMLGDAEKYHEIYHRAVAAGADSKEILAYLRSFDVEM